MLRRLAIHGVEVNPFKAAAEAEHEPGKLRQLAVGDGDVIADAGAPETLPVQEHVHHGLQREPIGTWRQGLGQFLQHSLFVGGLQIG